MRFAFKLLLAFFTTCVALLLLHVPLLRLPYFWDEAGYYIPAALDFYRWWLLIPKTTPPVGHPPLVMIYLGFAWHLFGYSAWAARGAMTLVAAATVTSLYGLGRRVGSPEIAAWSALLLALSPLFFAQSTLAHLDLAAALFTTLAVLLLLDDRHWLFALAASFAALSKETAVVLLPAVWLFAWRKGHASAAGRRASVATWVALISPLAPLAAWALYYHHATGYWMGNREYLSYNLYSTLSPARVFFSLLRRGYELFIGGFNWLLTASAAAGWWWGRKGKERNWKLETGNWNRRSSFDFPLSSFQFLAASLVTIYLLLLSLVGGAILPRYLLPVMPLFYLVAVGLVMRLPRLPARLILGSAAACLVAAWFINPPCPFPYEDNLSYAAFVRLHQQAARYLEAQPGQPRILTAWPATDELTHPFLGYVGRPLDVVPVPGFAPQEFANVSAESFDLLYLYSRKWEPPGNWAARLQEGLRLQAKYFDYHPQADAQALVTRYHLRMLREMERQGQWVRIYCR